MIKLILVVLFSSSLGWSGQEVGNGGDGVFCQASVDNSFSGFYSLDYLLTVPSANQNLDLAQIASIHQSLQRIRFRLEKVFPEFSESLNEFVSLIGNRDSEQRRVWEESPFGLIDIKDEKMIAQVPANCRSGERIQIQQAIVRQTPIFSGDEKRKELIIYKFVPSLLRDLETTSPVQLSFLYIHEWLWELSHDVDLNRRINRFLHSTDFETMSREDIRDRLVSWGLRIPRETPAKEFNFDWCPADPSSAKKLLKQLSQGAAAKILAPEGAVYGRQTICRVQAQFGCVVADQEIYGSPTSDVSLVWKPENSPKPFVFSGRMPALVRFNCALDPNTAQFDCTPLAASWPSFPNYNGTSQAGVTGRVGANGCIRMYQRENSWWLFPDGRFERREDHEFLFSANIK